MPKFIDLILISLLMLIPSAHGSELKVSIQLWSVKEELKVDFKGTIKALADMGFQGVEFANEFGEFANDPVGLVEFIRSQGLEISGAHTVFPTLEPDKIDATLAFYAAAEVPLVVIAWDDRAFDPTTVWQTIADLNRLYEPVTQAGFLFGYHNHAEEFAPYRGKTTLWDHIANSTPESLVMQLDAGWAKTAGINPESVVRQHPGRTFAIHYKASSPESAGQTRPIIGEDTINWAALIVANSEVGGTQWVVLEQEVYPDGLAPLDAIRLSKRALDGFLQTAER
ncbi:sugar phosphate isomerase [Arenicella chitinivorans]|uniref:Sugar phosphate isomerase n=1 Tax=Arenicella chitinivorans TaxID=1329800 RepID=A0A918REM3_9GAMM|nr:sugar phosphate isomerase/epimerase [Arenicella chitinivorans]GGZ96079.1 sugar phosphate isomerase [Arenicella chitinivorans]